MKTQIRIRCTLCINSDSESAVFSYCCILPI